MSHLWVVYVEEGLEGFVVKLTLTVHFLRACTPCSAHLRTEASATTLTTSVDQSSYTIGATLEAGEVPLTLGSAHSVWFAWLATFTGPAIASLEGSDFDTVAAGLCHGSRCVEE